MIKFPYTDFHEMNLDWVLNEVKECKEDAEDAVNDATAAVTTANAASTTANAASTTATTASTSAASAVSTANQALSAVNQAYEDLAFSHKFKMPHGNTAVNVGAPYYGFAVIIGDNDVISSFWKLTYSGGVGSVQMIFPTSALPAGTVNVSANGSQFTFSNTLTSNVRALLFDVQGTAEVNV